MSDWSSDVCSSDLQVADVSAYAGEALGAVHTVQAFTHEPLDVARFREQVESAFDVAMERVRARAMLTALVILLVFGAVGTILWMGGHEVKIGRATGRERGCQYM